MDTRSYNFVALRNLGRNYELSFSKGRYQYDLANKTGRAKVHVIEAPKEMTAPELLKLALKDKTVAESPKAIHALQEKLNRINLHMTMVEQRDARRAERMARKFEKTTDAVKKTRATKAVAKSEPKEVAVH